MFDKTLIVFTSDHDADDFLGDHWLGEKDLFHELSVRMPLIIVDPSSSADKTRGTVERRLVEAIDLLPTFLDIAGGQPHPQRLGRFSALAARRSCLNLARIHGQREIDYSGVLHVICWVTAAGVLGIYAAHGAGSTFWLTSNSDRNCLIWTIRRNLSPTG